jgi:hypothetical protein
MTDSSPRSSRAYVFPHRVGPNADAAELLGHTSMKMTMR